MSKTKITVESNADTIDVLIKAFETYIANTVSEYGESRMFDCGLDDARKVIKKAKKVK